jgi:ubiquinone/menaquinone biosynthesis C-methylase UbiE
VTAPERGLSRTRPSGARSISFDRGVDEYDRTRELPVPAMERVTAILLRELGPNQPCLEIGVGTGRIALPLAERGIRMVGIDLSTAMLERLIAKAGGRAVPLALADATALPFPDASFGSGLAVHVLHLIPDPTAALGELARVVRRPGIVVVDFGGMGRGWWSQLETRFCQAAGIPRRVVAQVDLARLDRATAVPGARARRLEPVLAAETTTIEEGVRRLEEGVYSFTWGVDEHVRREAGRQVRIWAGDRWGDLHLPRRSSRWVKLMAYDLV